MENEWGPTTLDETPSTRSMTDVQLAALDDDGAPVIPEREDTCPDEYAGCPPSSGWRSREYHTSLSEAPVVITTWEPIE